MSFVPAIASFIAQHVEPSDAPPTDGWPFVHTVASGLLQGAHNGAWSSSLLDWMNTSHKSMSQAASPADLNAWRDFYASCCLLRGLLLFNSLQYLEAISNLDHAIIVAGATSHLELVLSLIQKIQSCITDSGKVAMKEVQLLGPLSHDAPPTALKNTIPSLTPPSFLSFQTKFSKTPFILRNFASDWPAMRERPWRSASYLRSVAGPGRVVPVEVGNDYRSESWKQKIMSWDEFLSTLDFEDQTTSDPTSDLLYLAQHDLTVQFPCLRDDISLPDYIYASLNPSDYTNYHPPHNIDGVLFNTWLGPKGAMSPAHTDPYHNFYVQLAGYKSVWLAPPSASVSMYPLQSSTEINRTSSSSTTAEEKTTSNTSQVDVFRDTPDRVAFPGFEKDVMPISMTACLEPGDALFFPPGWWHAMRSESTSFSLSMWF